MENNQLLASFDDLIALLEQNRIPYRIANPSSHSQVELPTRIGALQSQLMIIWGPTAPILQCIHPLPFRVPEERVAAIESAIARINHALVLPGFGLNHKVRLIYYRLSIPRRDNDQLSAQEFQKACQTAIGTAADFYLPLKKVALENQAADAILNQTAPAQSGSNL
ncbi:MAG: YbjN domain-containing protein [Cyanobacteria bacterium J06626_18]